MKTVMVLGAGMVGVATALALQARGYDTVVVDRRSPGEETSHGCSGIIQADAAEPHAMPRDLRSLFSILFKTTNDVNWNWSAIPEHFVPLMEYFRNSAPEKHRAIARTFRKLTARATDEHAPLIAAAGADHLIRRTGFRVGFRSSSIMEKEAAHIERLNREYGYGIKVIDGQELAKAEPNLKQAMAGAIHFTGSWTCLSPGDLVTAYAALFVARGGTILTGDAMSLAPNGEGWSCCSADGPIEAEHAVVALGPWSAELLARLGYRVPLFRKRGYHRHFEAVRGPKVSFLDAENGSFITVMAKGLRITTGAEITRIKAPAALRQMETAERAARELFELGNALEEEPWFGSRPCLPDMLPLVGAAPSHPGLWMNIGHGHQGFSLGPTTGGLLADLMEGNSTEFMNDLAYRWS